MDNFEKISLLLGQYKIGEKDAQILYGDFIQSIKNTILRFCPSGKVLILSNSKSFTLYGKSVNDAVAECGVQSNSVIFEESDVDTLENAVNLSSLPEDVRLIIVLDGTLMNVACYYAGIHQIPVAYVVGDLSPDCLFPTKIILKNGGKIDSYNVLLDRIFIFDKRLIEQNPLSLSLGYAGVLSKLTALYDYRINCSARGAIANKVAYDMLKSAVTDTFAIFNYDKGVRFSVLSLNVFKCALACALTNGEILSSSSANTASVYMLLNYLNCKEDKTNGDNGLNQTVAEFFAFQKILALYSSVLKDVSFLQVVDYNATADDLNEFIGVDRANVINGYLSQIQLINKNRKAISTVKENVIREASATAKVLEKINSTYLALGGAPLSAKIKHLLRKAVKFSGDFGANINGVTLLRESAVTNLF